MEGIYYVINAAYGRFEVTDAMLNAVGAKDRSDIEKESKKMNNTLIKWLWRNASTILTCPLTKEDKK